MRLLELFRNALAGPRALMVLAILYLTPRLLILLIPIEYHSDAQWYFSRAAGIASGLGYSEAGSATAYWPPGWPLLLGGAFKLFGTSIATVKGLNFLFAAAAGWLTWVLGRQLFGSELAGRAGLLILAIYPNSIGYVPLALTEVFYTTLVLAICWVLITGQGIRRLVVAGLLLGVASLVKAQSIVLIPLLFLVTWLDGARTWNRLWKAVLQATLTVVVAAAVVAPWSYRNQKVFGEFIPISTNGGLTLLTGNNPSAKGDYTYDDPLVTSIHRTVPGQVQVDREARQRATNWIKENPERFAVLMPLKLWRLWAPDGESEWGYQAGYQNYEIHWRAFRALRIWNQVFYAMLMIGFVSAGLMLWRGKEQARLGISRWGGWLLPYAIAMYPSLIAIVFSGQSRFHYPVMPFVAMACGWLITRNWQLEETRKPVLSGA